MRPNKEKTWEQALTSIIEELSKSQFEKMLHLLVGIPKPIKEKAARDEIPQIIIQHLGIKKSILTMENILKKIPRRDPEVQVLLRPFVDKLSKSSKENNKGPKRTSVESDTEDEEPEAAPKKRKYVSESETESEEGEVGGRNEALPEFDDDYLREAEKNLTKEERESRQLESLALKEKGNGRFKAAEHREAERSYTEALGVCPVCFSSDRAVLFSNRAAARLHLDLKDQAIADCSRAIELNPDYVRAILRRAELYEKTDKLDEALRDFKTVLEKEPGQNTAMDACMRLLQQIHDRDEKMDREEKKHQSDKENAGPSCEPWRQTVQQLNAIGYLKGKAIKGKVIQKSGLRPYETKKKEKKFWFFVGFADDTGATKLTVYGRPFFDMIKEGHFYKFKDLLVDEQAIRVTSNSNILKLGHKTPLTISADLEMKAKMLINTQWPVFSIAEAKNSQEKTEMTIEGTITDMKNAEDQKVKGARTRKKTTKLRKLTLEEDSESIQVCFWGDQVGLCRSLLVGDTIRVANVRSTEFMGIMTLNSTGMTQVYPVKAASVQTVRVEIIGIFQASKMETTLEAELNEQTPKFVVESKLLAKACGFRLEGDIEEKLLDQIPFSAEVTMQGNKITAITKM